MHRLPSTLLSLCCVLLGCALFQKGAPDPIELRLQVAGRFNPAEDGQSLPTVVRVYQLKSPTKFEAADHMQIYRADKETLGEDLLKVEEFVVSPGERIERRIPSDQATRAVAVMVMVRKPSGTGWRVVQPLSGGKRQLELQLEDFRVVKK